MFKLLMENCIGRHGQEYKCFICHCTLPFDNFQVIEEHIQKEHHRAVADIRAWHKIPQSKEVKKLGLLSEEEYEELVKNKIIFKIKHYYCYYCKCSLSRPDEHIGGKAHRRRYDFQNTHINGRSRDKAPKVEIKKVSKPKGKENFFRGTISLKQHHIKLVESTNTFVCEICECSLPDQSNVFCHIEENVHEYKLAQQEVNPVIQLHKINCDIHCKKCNILLNNNETLLQCHCLFHLYKEQPNIKLDIVKFQFDKNHQVDISCLLCNVTAHSDKEMAVHLDEKSHLDSLNLWNRSIRRNSRKVLPDASDKIGMNSKELDNYIFDPAEDLEICMKDKNNENMINLEEYDKFYKCFLCRKSFDSITTLFQHCGKSFIHNHKLKIFFMIYNSSNAVDIQDLLVTNNTSRSYSSRATKPLNNASSRNLTNTVQAKPSSKQVDKTVDKVVKKKEKKDRKPRERKNPLAYNQDILDIGDSYISMCLESGSENIYNVDKDAIHQMEFGTCLTVSMKPSIVCEPFKHERMCIPCGYKILPSFYYLCEHLQHEIHIQNLDDMVASNKDFDGYKDQFSDLDLAKSYMLEESDEEVKCFACEKLVPNSDNEIKNHICLPAHILKMQLCKKDADIINENMSIFLKNLWYYIDRFSCKLCNVRFDREIRFVKHLQDKQHCSSILKLNEKENNKINICFGCCSCWFGESNYMQHYTEPLHIQAFKRFDELLPQIPKKAITYLMNSDQIVQDLIDDSNEIAYNQQYKEQKLLESAEETVRSFYPNVKAYAFGSRTSYLGLATSDVDVFIDCENKYSEIGSKEVSQAYIQTTKNQFCKKYAHIWKKEKILLNPRVPIMKMEHKTTKLKCDISFLSGLGVEKSKLIRNYVIAYKHCRKLILYLKQWFSMCDLYGPQAVNAYAISWYAIFFLQIKGILPSVKKLIEWKDQSKIVDGWQCGFPDKLTVSDTSYSFQDILQGFFSYYAEFDFCTNVVCPLLGQVLKKRTFVTFDDLPDGMEIYKNRVQTEEMEFFRYDSPMCIQDPVDLTQNITKAVSKYQLRYFKSYCAQSFKILSE
ncbi:uncharacterized protein LOC100117932 isoform X1 [Nasonia vitripennis]|uniref:C2H2-type domain-containing protein n=1 Tax=Nasonia vitripennis TaxID=7425 RepID=A0A7M7G4A1_NASVI|nr:uncharacterized protein LOC100117932 isoform X1 [Nasonia vitripennis]